MTDERWDKKFTTHEGDLEIIKRQVSEGDRFKDASGVIVEKDEIILDDSSIDDPLAGPPPE